MEIITAVLVGTVIGVVLGWLFGRSQHKRVMNHVAQREMAYVQVINKNDDEIGELQQKLQVAKEESLRDPLTGLYGRRAFGEMLSQQLAQLERQQGVVACTVLFIDVDEFKSVNDTYGHRVGDQVLCEVAQCLRGMSRGSDVVARISGDEFAVLLPNVMLPGGEVYAERLLASVHKIRVAEQPDLRVTLSVGVATSYGQVDQQSLMETADQLMYQAKQAGRDGWQSAAMKAA